MSKQNERIMERFKKIRQDKKERDRQRYDKDYKVEQEGFIPDKR